MRSSFIFIQLGIFTSVNNFVCENEFYYSTKTKLNNKIIKAKDQSDHVTKLYINSFIEDNLFILQNIFWKVWKT